VLVGDVAFNVTLIRYKEEEHLSVRPPVTPVDIYIYIFIYVCPHHVNEVGQDALHLVNVDVLHLHHPQSHQEGVQRQLVSPQQQIPAASRQSPRPFLHDE